MGKLDWTLAGVAMGVGGALGAIAGFVAWLIIESAEAAPDKASGHAVYEGDTPPEYVSKPWTQNSTKWRYDYNDSLAHWLGPTMVFAAAKGGANISGALKFEGMNMDSTSATEVGIILPFDFLITRVTLNCDDGSGAVDTKANFVSGGGTSHFTVTWPGSTYKDTTMGFEMAAETEFEVYVTGGVVQPDDPVVIFYGMPIVDE